MTEEEFAGWYEEVMRAVVYDPAPSHLRDPDAILAELEQLAAEHAPDLSRLPR